MSCTQRIALLALAEGLLSDVNTDLAVKHRADLEDPDLEILVCPSKTIAYGRYYRYPDAKDDCDHQLEISSGRRLKGCRTKITP